MDEIERSDRPGSTVEPRLWRSTDKKVLAGVVGGLAERFRIDATFLRVLWVIFFIFSGFIPAAFVYGVLWYIMPLRTE